MANPDAYVVRLDQKIALKPANVSINLLRAYVLPGEVISLDVPASTLKTLTDVTLSPATVYGYSVDQYTAPVEH